MCFRFCVGYRRGVVCLLLASLVTLSHLALLDFWMGAAGRSAKAVHTQFARFILLPPLSASPVKTREEEYPSSILPSHPAAAEVASFTSTHHELPRGVNQGALVKPAEELLHAARPVGHWVLDESAVATCMNCRLEVGIWVSADGQLLHWQLINSDPPGEWAMHSLAPLAQTPMEPAVTTYGPVPSYLVVEINISYDGSE